MALRMVGGMVRQTLAKPHPWSQLARRGLVGHSMSSPKTLNEILDQSKLEIESPETIRHIWTEVSVSREDALLKAIKP
eukprot:9494133-Pyramimonas_sp.AAC.2